MKKLHKDYIQKSRIFLYPSLDIRRGTLVKPVQTYVAWEEIVTPKDRKLICVYNMEDSEQFKTFERVKLLGNKMFCDFRQTDDGKGIYIFTFDDKPLDFDRVVAGKYSQLSEATKKEIKSYYGTSSSTHEYVMSYLYPDDYFNIYAELLGVEVDLLKQVGELCAPLDIDKETLKIPIESLEMKDLII